LSQHLRGQSTVAWFIFLFVIFSAQNIIPNSTISEGLFQLSLISLTGVGIIAYVHFISTLVIRRIERDYLVKLNNEGKLTLMWIKLRLKKPDTLLKGKLVSLDLSTFVIQEEDGYRLSLEYKKVETISAKPDQEIQEIQ